MTLKNSQTSSSNHSYGLSQWNHQYHKLWCPDPPSCSFHYLLSLLT